MEYTIGEYNRVIEKLGDVFCDVWGVISVLQFGTINAPGNSDVDLIFVIRENRNIRSEVLETFTTRFSREEQYLVFQHEPFFLSERLIENVNIIRPSKNVRLIFGKNFNIQSEVGLWHSLYILIEIITTYYPCYLTAFSDNRVNHQIVNAFGHTYDLYRSISNDLDLDVSFESRLHALLRDNDQMRKQSDIEAHAQKRFIADAKLNILDFVFKMCEALDLALEPFIRDSRLETAKVYKGKIFSNKTGRCWQTRVLGKSINIMHYPLSFSYFFAENDYLADRLETAVRRRNEILKKYSRFCMEILGGVYFYRPWWMQWKDSTRSRVKNATLNIISRVI